MAHHHGQIKGFSRDKHFCPNGLFQQGKSNSRRPCMERDKLVSLSPLIAKSLLFRTHQGVSPNGYVYAVTHGHNKMRWNLSSAYRIDLLKEPVSLCT